VRAVADRTGGTLWDVVRLALPPRHARVEAEPPARTGPRPAARAGPGSWARYTAGPAFSTALARAARRGRSGPALPGPDLARRGGDRRARVRLGGRGAVVVVPTRATSTGSRSRSATVDAAVACGRPRPGAALPRVWRARRGEVRVVRAPAPPRSRPCRPRLVVVWDDGDDLHVEPRSPVRARARGAGAARAPDRRGRDRRRPRAHGRGAAARGERVGARRRRDPGAGARGRARRRRRRRRPAGPRPARPCRAASRRRLRRRAHLPRGRSPVLVQVPRAGGRRAWPAPSTARPARCPQCAGPLAEASRDGVLSCRWCGRLASTGGAPPARDGGCAPSSSAPDARPRSWARLPGRGGADLRPRRRPGRGAGGSRSRRRHSRGRAGGRRRLRRSPAARHLGAARPRRPAGGGGGAAAVGGRGGTGPTRPRGRPRRRRGRPRAAAGAGAGAVGPGVGRRARAGRPRRPGLPPCRARRLGHGAGTQLAEVEAAVRDAAVGDLDVLGPVPAATTPSGCCSASPGPAAPSWPRCSRASSPPAAPARPSRCGWSSTRASSPDAGRPLRWTAWLCDRSDCSATPSCARPPRS
jgi:hypothetical protein